ncbi:disease resistance protein RPM1-like [Euphorbia lathyris]|uniref:disease resistance protein RPM1-like n=1 Tax=Euphorbia lathyris TaxID=212925 RepID=UPI0033138667
MADGTVKFLLTQLSAFLKEEYKLLNGVEADVTFMEDGFALTSAFLRVAEVNEEHNSNDLIKAWVNNLRDTSFDMQDVLDEFKLHFAHNRGHTGTCTTTLEKTCHFIYSLKARHQIAKRMKGIRSRLHDITETYNSLQTTNQNIRLRGINDGGTAIQRNDQPDALLDQRNLVGITRPKNHLIGWLLNSKSDREAVSVVGEGGLGKTTLIKQVYDDAEVKKHFKFRAWITLTRHFKTVDLLKDMLQQLLQRMRRPNPSGVDNMGSYSLASVINDFLVKRRYLIVLDDVWEHEAWDVFQMAFPNNNKGSRILLTTQILPVANRCCSESSDRIYRMEPLPRQESWALFCNYTFQRNPCPENLLNISDRILNKCEGLPLAIVAISGVLAAVDTSRLEEWEMVYRSLGAEIQGSDSLGRMRKVLLLSYYFLPSNLQSCLLYFCIFPECYPIEKMRLIRLWIAEGFVTRTEGKTLEEVAESYLNGLIERSLIQVVETTSDDRVKRCRIQGLLREVIISKAKELSFAAKVTEGSIIPEKVRRLSIHNAGAGTRTPYFASRLCSLLVFSGLEPLPEFLPFSLTSAHLKMLFVLDLSGTPLQVFPDEVTTLLLLKYLSLRDTKVNSIPSSIQKLQYLETLDLKNSCVTELPTSIVNLQKLRHLLVYRYETEVDDHLQTKYTIGFRLPTTTHIRGLQSLQKLCFLEPNGNTSLLQELGTLKRLRRLGIVNMREEDGEHLCSSILKLTNLRTLSLSSIKESEVINLNPLNSAPTYLQRLYLTGCLGTLPRWMSSLDNLKKLVFKWSRLTENPLPDLQRLPNLLHLEFLEAYDGETLRFEGGFKKLKFLGINKLDRLKEISVGRGAMRCLQKLIVQRCQLLKKVPSGIEHLHRLKVVEFINMPIELIMTLHPDRDEYGDYTRVARVPEVNFYTYWNNGSWDVFSLERFRKEILAQPDRRIINTTTYARQLSAVAKDGGGCGLTPIIGMMSVIIIIVATFYQWQ